MQNILFWSSLYFLLVTCILLFFSSVSYSENPCVSVYENEISSFYDKFIFKMETSGEKIMKIFFSNTIVGAMYRHSLVKEYLKNNDKLRALNFTESEIESINKLIVPGFNERILLFNMLRVIFILTTVVLAVIIGSII